MVPGQTLDPLVWQFPEQDAGWGGSAMACCTHNQPSTIIVDLSKLARVMVSTLLLCLAPGQGSSRGSLGDRRLLYGADAGATCPGSAARRVPRWIRFDQAEACGEVVEAEVVEAEVVEAEVVEAEVVEAEVVEVVRSVAKSPSCFGEASSLAVSEPAGADSPEAAHGPCRCAPLPCGCPSLPSRVRRISQPPPSAR